MPSRPTNPTVTYTAPADPWWKRQVKLIGKVALGTVTALIVAGLFSLLVLGGAITGLLNGMKAESSAADDTAVTQEDVFPGDDTAIGGPTGEPTEETATVLLEGNASGPATVTWNTPGSYGNTYDLPEGGPWELEIPDGEREGSYSVTVSSEDYENASTVSCKIVVDQTIPSDGQSQADGVGAIADCNTD